MHPTDTQIYRQTQRHETSATTGSILMHLVRITALDFCCKV